MDMGDYHAPQWRDFIGNSSPQPVVDFFDTVHSLHERVLQDSIAEHVENIENIQPTESQNNINTKVQEDLNIIRSTPVKVISPKHRNNKETMVGETTYEQVLSDAMKKLELCKRPLRASRDVLNKATTQKSDTFKTPSMPIIKSSKSVGHRSASTKLNVPLGQNSAPRAAKVSRNTSVKGTSVNPKRASVSCSLFNKEDKDDVKHDTPKRPNNPVDDPKNDEKADKEHKDEDNEKREEEKNEEHKTEDNEEGKEECNEEDAAASQDEAEEPGRDNVDAKIEKHNQTLPNKRLGLLTWQNRRRSLHKRRSGPTNNQYVSMAEAVSRFQTETPKRFRTRSAKENQAAGMTMNALKLVQNRLKPTIAISPALMSKNRTRAVTVLSQEEREKQQMEEIKKHPIKANPIPRAVLQGPRMKVAGTTKKKQATPKTETSSSQPNKKNCAANVLHSRTTSLHHNKATSVAGPKNTVTRVLVTDPSGIIVEHEEITFFGVPKETGATKSATRVVPFSFEARNKDLQMKKEKRLKSLQEASKAKVGFQARPAPNFSKAPTPTAKQQQPSSLKKSTLLPCPFSFEARDKKLPKRKDQLVKQLLDEDKRARVFRAKPVPVFKPVMVRGRSREHLSIRDKSTKMASEQKECEDQENREPNIDTESKSVQKTNSLPCIVDKASLTERTERENREENAKALPIELHSDKRAKERREFDEKLRRKEMEHEVMREEENKKQMEHEKQIRAELRKMTEVKARPMPAYKQMVIEKATKELTDPQSPAFVSKLRRKEI